MSGQADPDVGLARCHLRDLLQLNHHFSVFSPEPHHHNPKARSMWANTKIDQEQEQQQQQEGTLAAEAAAADPSSTRRTTAKQKTS